MTTRRRLLFWLLPAVLAGGLAFWLLLRQDSGVQYQGQALKDLLASQDLDDLSRAAANIGPSAIPLLVNTLDPEPGLWQRFGVPTSDPPSAARARFSALTLLSQWGPEASNSLPALLKVVDRDEPGWELALLAAARISPNAPAVRTALAARLAGPAEPRGRAAWIIYHQRLRAPDFIPPLLGALKDIRLGRPLDRQPVSEMLALSLQETSSAAGVPEIVKAWEIPDFRGAALAALLEYGPSASPATPLLTEALTDDRSRPFWPEILHILARIGPAAEPATTALARRIEHPDPLIHGLASYAAASIRQSTNFAVTALHTLLLDTNYSRARATLPLRVGEQNQGLGHREAAAWLLGEIGPPAADALPALRSLQGDPNLWLRLFAARAIWRISAQPDALLAAAERELKGDNDAAAVWICQLLAEVGPSARAFETALKSAMTRNLKVRSAAFQALQKIIRG